MGITISQLLLAVTAVHFFSMPALVGVNLLVGSTIASVVPGLFYAIRHRSANALWACPYSSFWVFSLSWIGLYAMFTSHKSGWLTRGVDRPVRTAESIPHQEVIERRLRKAAV